MNNRISRVVVGFFYGMLGVFSCFRAWCCLAIDWIMNYGKKVVVIVLLLASSFAVCEQTPEQEAIERIVETTNRSVVEYKVQKRRWSWELAAIGALVAGVGIADMAEGTTPSIMCGSTWLIAGGALIVISF